MNLYRPKLSDDRGTRYPMATPIEVSNQSIEIFKLTTPPCTDTVEYRIVWRWIFSAGTLVLFLYWPINNLFTNYLSGRLGLNSWIVMLMAAMLCLPLYWIAYVFFSKSTSVQYLRILKHNSICPSCLFGLTDLPIKPDGCTVCPECGAAWRLPEAKPNEPSP